MPRPRNISLLSAKDREGVLKAAMSAIPAEPESPFGSSPPEWWESLYETTWDEYVETIREWGVLELNAIEAVLLQMRATTHEGSLRLEGVKDYEETLFTNDGLSLMGLNDAARDESEHSTRPAWSEMISAVNTYRLVVVKLKILRIVRARWILAGQLTFMGSNPVVEGTPRPKSHLTPKMNNRMKWIVHVHDTSICDTVEHMEDEWDSSAHKASGYDIEFIDDYGWDTFIRSVKRLFEKYNLGTGVAPTFGEMAEYARYVLEHTLPD